MDKPVSDALGPTARTRVKRLPKRGHYERSEVNEVFDAGFICHIGYVIDGQPYVTPTAYWREGNHIYWHGSSASRMLRAQKTGILVCLTVTHIDGLVMARSAFNHSVNYRSVMLFGQARRVQEPAQKLRQLELFTRRMYPGRWEQLRPVTEQELKATTVLEMKIEEGAAKVRSGPPKDDAEDYTWPVWAGVVPVRMVAGPPADDGRLVPGVSEAGYLSALDQIGLSRSRG